MTFSVETCVVLHCDGDECERVFDDDPSSEYGYTAHFDTEDAALEAARSNDNEWVVAGRTAKCPQCVAKAQCGLMGHDFSFMGEWRDIAVDNAIHQYVGRARHCGNCNGIEFDPPHPDHPLSIAASAPC